MRVGASIKSAKNRDKDCQVVRRRKSRRGGKGKKIVLKVINKKNPKFKASQG